MIFYCSPDVEFSRPWPEFSTTSVRTGSRSLPRTPRWGLQYAVLDLVR